MNSLLYFFPGIEPTILLYVTPLNPYLGENIQAYGYFIANNTLIANHTISLYWNETLTEKNLTNEDGRFEILIPVPLDTLPGPYIITAQSNYASKIYSSDSIFITIKKIPTNISLSCHNNHFYLNETIEFAGKLVDYKYRGITNSIVLTLADIKIPLQTDSDGNFAFNFNDYLPFGSYFAQVFYTPNAIYEPCVSNLVPIFIDTPTNLSIFSTETEVVTGQHITIFGRLLEGINNTALTNKSIFIYHEDDKVGSVTSNSSGWYSFSYQTHKAYLGKHTFYAHYIPEGNTFRNSTSEKIIITIQSGFPLVVELVLLFLILFIMILTFIFRKKLVQTLFSKPPLRQEEKERTIEPVPPKKKIQFNKHDFTIDISKKKKDDYNKAIVSHYTKFLTFLTKTGVLLRATQTHHDIKKMLVTEGFSKTPTEKVTLLFEKAMYSPHPIEHSDLIQFNTNIEVMINDYGGL